MDINRCVNVMKYRPISCIRFSWERSRDALLKFSRFYNEKRFVLSFLFTKTFLLSSMTFRGKNQTERASTSVVIVHARLITSALKANACLISF